MININDLSISSINRALTKLSRQICCSSGGGDLRPYNVYTALLTQSGSDDIQLLIGTSLTIGVTYQIQELDGVSGWDFTNVGAPNNDVGTYFVATGTTPNSWTSAQLEYNTGAPVVTVLENTIGNIYYQYISDGEYEIISNGLFTLNNTWVICPANSSAGSTNVFYPVSVFQIVLKSANSSTIFSNDLFNATAIEIRVYN